MTIPTRYSLVEQETVVRWDRTPAPAMLYTAAPLEAARWRKLGYTVDPMGAHGWQAQIPKKAVRFRRLVAGKLPQRAPSGVLVGFAARQKVAR